MIKKLYLPLLLGVLLTGCGGGGTTSASLSDTQATATTPTTGSSENPVSISSLLDITLNSIPYQDAPIIEASTKQSYLAAINDARKSVQICNGKSMGPVNPLAWSDILYNSAYEHTNDLVETDTFSHDGSNTNNDWTATVQELDRGSEAHERMANNGYKIAVVGENITAGFEDRDPNKPKDTAKMAVSSWLASTDGHCENLMNPAYTEVGMAYIKKGGTKYVHYWTQNLGKPQ